MKNKYTISEVRPRIFFLKFKNHYDLCMQFVRYQEFYESASPRFRDKPFELLDYMKWYAEKYGEGVFTYTKGWAGFNISADIIKRVWDLGIADRNLYDYEMKFLYQKFLEQYPDGKFYIIGACNSGITMRHEIAHGFFHVIPEYKVEMTKLVKSLKKQFFKSMCNQLRDMGYPRKVYIDECQAYLSTGIPVYWDSADDIDEKFATVFNKYYKNEISKSIASVPNAICETYADGTKHWYRDGKLHREDGPAVEYANGDKYWYRDGKHHREDGPAVELANGTKAWYRDGKFHREDGPAIEYANGTKHWYRDGKYHREDGPAVEYANGNKLWYLKGIKIECKSNEEFLKLLKMKAFW